MDGSDIKTGIAGLDPRSHVVALVSIGAASLTVAGIVETTLCQLLAALYLATNGRCLLAARSCGCFAFVCALSFLPLSGLYGVLLVSILHMAPPFTAGCAFFTLSPSALMCALGRWKMPQMLVVGVCMVFRFAAVLPAEARSISQGIRMRGVFPAPLDLVRHPALAYECLYTPLVMRTLRLSSELAASASLRGAEIEGGRTSVYHVGFTGRDVLWLALVVCASAGLCAVGSLS